MVVERAVLIEEAVLEAGVPVGLTAVAVAWHQRKHIGYQHRRSVGLQGLGGVVDESGELPVLLGSVGRRFGSERQFLFHR